MMHARGYDFNLEHFNALPNVERADQVRRSTGSLKRGIAALQPTFSKHDMCDRWGITMLHKHWSVDQHEIPLQEIGSLEPLEFLTTPHRKLIRKEFWPLTLVVTEELKLAPMEFSTDRHLATLNEDLAAKPDFVDDVCDALRSLGLERTFGLIALKANSHPGLKFVEYNPSSRMSVLREIPSNHVAPQNLIETCWRIPILEASVDCAASCFATCTIDDAGHTGNHTPIHNPNG